MAVSIRSRIVGITTIILCLALGANTFLSSYLFAREYTEAMTSRGTVIAQPLHLAVEKGIACPTPF